MTSPKEHRAILERELLKVGVKPEVQLTDGGHLRVRFVLNGKLKSVLTSATPSDHRATLNARANIRRILRQERVFAARASTSPERALVQKAFLAPIVPDVSLVERIRRLEEDNEAMLDLLADLAAKLNTSMEPAQPAVDLSTKKKSIRDKVLFELCAGPVPIKELAKRLYGKYDPLAKSRTNVLLVRMKKAGLVTNPQRGVWTRIKQLANGESIARPF